MGARSSDTSGLNMVLDTWRKMVEDDSLVVAEGGKCSRLRSRLPEITQRDLCRLNVDKPRLLNDAVMNMYMAMINERGRLDKELPRVHCFNSYFYTQLRVHGFEKVESWIPKVDLFSMQHIIVPVHLKEHWTTAVINLRHKRFEYYDSFYKSSHYSGPEVLERLRTYMNEKGASFDGNLWEDYTPTTQIPQQTNSYDCGVFACQFSEYRSRDSSEVPPSGENLFDFDQKDIPYFRQRMACEILSLRLMT